MAPKRASWKRWSPADDEKLLRLCGRFTFIGVNGNGVITEQDWTQIADEFEGRSTGACKTRLVDLRNSAAGKPKPCRARAKVVHGADSDFARSYQSPISLPDPVSITAMIFGDPLPGRSALDHKLQGNTHA